MVGYVLTRFTILKLAPLAITKNRGYSTEILGACPCDHRQVGPFVGTHLRRHCVETFPGNAVMRCLGLMQEKKRHNRLDASCPATNLTVGQEDSFPVLFPACTMAGTDAHMRLYRFVKLQGNSNLGLVFA